MEIPEDILRAIEEDPAALEHHIGIVAIGIDVTELVGIACLGGITKSDDHIMEAIDTLRKISAILRNSPGVPEKFGIKLDSLNAQVVNLYNVLLNITTRSLVFADDAEAEHPEVNDARQETARLIRSKRDDFAKWAGVEVDNSAYAGRTDYAILRDLVNFSFPNEESLKTIPTPLGRRLWREAFNRVKFL